MKAKKKPLEKKTLADFGVDNKKRLKTLKVTGKRPPSSSLYSPLFNELTVFLLAILQNRPPDKEAEKSKMLMVSFPGSRSSVPYERYLCCVLYSML
jgi:hypothetical protein